MIYVPISPGTTSSFTPQEKNVIVQMDEMHVKSDVSYKGGKLSDRI